MNIVDSVAGRPVAIFDSAGGTVASGIGDIWTTVPFGGMCAVGQGLRV